jgi:hypothetical protein
MNYILACVLRMLLHCHVAYIVFKNSWRDNQDNQDNYSSKCFVHAQMSRDIFSGVSG